MTVYRLEEYVRCGNRWLWREVADFGTWRGAISGAVRQRRNPEVLHVRVTEVTK